MNALTGLALVLGGLVVTADAAPAYTGGPVQATLLGYDPRELKLFYSMKAHGDVGDPGRYFYIQFDSIAAPRVVEARSLGLVHPPGRAYDRELAKKLIAFRQRLMPLRSPDGYEVRTRVDVAERDTEVNHDVPKFLLRVDLESGGVRAALDVEAYCRTTVTVTGVYQIPDRPERVVMLSYTGDAYGCEPVDVPIVLTATQTAARLRPTKYVP